MRNYVINTFNKKSKIMPEIYGHFAEHLGNCIYQGLYVGRDSEISNKNGVRLDVIEALKNLNIPVLRWPGGCFADTYHWKSGIGKLSERKKIVNSNWGNVIEDNSFGTHEFLDLCEELRCEPYIAGNVGSGSPQEMADWVEYVTGAEESESEMVALRKRNGRTQPWKVKYWGIGNECWGCGGAMTPEHYSDLLNTFYFFAHRSAHSPMYGIASGAFGSCYSWTEKVVEKAMYSMNGISLHHYSEFRPSNTPGPEGKIRATKFSEREYFGMLKSSLLMKDYIRKHSNIIELKGNGRSIDLIIDEWGTWFRVEPGTNPDFLYQQNSLLDALIASATFNIFNKNSNVVKMANIAQLVNVLQSVILTEEDKMILTPTYFAFYMYKAHMNSTLVDSYIQTEIIGSGDQMIEDISESSSVTENGNLIITITNFDIYCEKRIRTTVIGTKLKKCTASILTAEKMDYHNTFENPDKVKLREFNDFELTDDGIDFTMPTKSILVFEINVE